MSHSTRRARHDSLKPFSREYVFELGHAQRLLSSVAGNGALRKKTLNEFLGVWGARISQHFAQEERLLCPLMTPMEGILFRYMQDQVRTLAREGDARSRSLDPGMEWIAEMGQKLMNFVRWEEDHLMDRLQRTCSGAQLNALRVQSEGVFVAQQNDWMHR